LAWDRSGEVFNLDSPKEVARVLEKMGVSLPRTEKDNPETSAKALTPLIKQYPIIDDILFYRSLVKERTTYVEPLLNCTSEKKSTVVFKFTAPGAPTGRFSSGGVDEGDPCYAPMNVQAIISSAGYRLARCRKVSIPGVSAYD
jgi:DNA polymerase I-like protein with 3'-5' exonuclease and polymerase domains